jgi:hypothetical protein
MMCSKSCLHESLGVPYLHRHQPVIDKDLLSQEIGTDSRLVASTELFVDLYAAVIVMLATPLLMRLREVRRQRWALRSRGRTHILVHQACFADTAITKDNHLL